MSTSGASASERAVRLVLDEHAEGLADLGGGDLAGNALLETHGFPETRLLHLRKNLARHLRRPGTLLAGIGKDPKTLETDGGDEIEQGLEMLLGLAGEADDERGAERQPGDARAEAADQLFDMPARGFAPHTQEHLLVDVLERHIDIPGNLVARGDGLDEFVAPMSRMGIEEANPEIALDFL